MLKSADATQYDHNEKMYVVLSRFLIRRYVLDNPDDRPQHDESSIYPSAIAAQAYHCYFRRKC